MSRPAPVVFDLDGTLIDSLPGIAKAGNAVLADEGLPHLPQAAFTGFVGHGARVFMDRLIAATALDPARDALLMARFMEHYARVGRETPLFPGVRDMLAALREEGRALGLCTNKPSGPLASVIEALALDAVFDVTVAGDSLAQRKPDPAPLLHCFDVLGAPGVYVGDSEVDAETAKRARLPFVLYTEGIRLRPVEALPHQAVFDDFAALPGVLFWPLS